VPEVASVLKVDPALESRQVEKLKRLRERRDADAVRSSLEKLSRVAQSDGNIVPPVLEAVEAYATVGEISDVFRQLWGEYHDNR